MNDKPIKHYSGIGGLAVLDGVMMRNRDRYAVAVRKEDGSVALKVEHWHALLEGSALWALMDERSRRIVFPEEHGIRIRGERTGQEPPLPAAPRAAR